MARLTLTAQLRETAEMIKISHSVFALPFALAAGALAMAGEGWSWATLWWIVFCAVTARTAAMAQNRYADARLDARNPRTASRALPAGRVTANFVLALVLASAGLFVFGAWMLNPLCFHLSPVALGVLLSYPYAKRFTSLGHLWLGVALGLSPVGAWLAVRGAWSGWETPVLLGGAVMLWTAGFDLIYACQDFDHDRAAGLHSLPVQLGVAGALRLSEAMHAVCILLLGALFLTDPHVGWLYGTGLALAAGLLCYEHAIVSPTDLSRVNIAFFRLNGLVSLVLGACTIVDAFV